MSSEIPPLPLASAESAPGRSAEPAPAFDPRACRELVEAIGEETVARLARKLRGDLVTRFDAALADAGELVRQAHTTRPAAGLLGLAALAEACWALERADPPVLDVALASLARRRDEAIGLLSWLLAGATKPAAGGFARQDAAPAA